jgi:hypothetical protein
VHIHYQQWNNASQMPNQTPPKKQNKTKQSINQQKKTTTNYTIHMRYDELATGMKLHPFGHVIHLVVEDHQRFIVFSDASVDLCPREQHLGSGFAPIRAVTGEQQ